VRDDLVNHSQDMRLSSRFILRMGHHSQRMKTVSNPEHLLCERRNRGSGSTCSKRRNRSASLASASGSSLIATSRPSRVSRARYTSPMPPAPSGDWIS